jgi:hypothetical protein
VQALNCKNAGRKVPVTFDGAHAGWLHDDGCPVLAKVKFGTNGSGVEPWLYDQGPFGLLEFDQLEERS